MSAKKKKKSKKPAPRAAAPDTSPAQSPAEEEEILQVMAEPHGDDSPAQPAPPAEDPLKDQLLRLQADFDNFRRRTQRERNELYQRANEDLIRELLSVLDHFELGFENAANHEANPDVVSGFRMVFDQTLSTLAKFGLQPIDAMGEAFDPHAHEAVTQLPSEEVPEDVVLAQTRRGYRLADRLLRASQVVVSAGPGPQPPPVTEEVGPADALAHAEEDA